MTTSKPKRPRRAGVIAAALACAALATPALAQEAMGTAPADAPPAPPPSDSMAVNLVRLLVQQGVITQEAADTLIAQAQSEARAAAAAPAPLPAVAAGSQRIPYVPEVVRNQIRDEVKAEVLAQAQAENWAAPNQIPAWTQRIEWSGDLRVRSQYDLYDDVNTPEFIDFAAFNGDGPTDINPDTNPAGLPFLNTREDRLNRLAIRARLGMTAKLTDEVTVGVRLATGSSDSPVSTNSALGGGFSKKDFWIDRAYVTLEPVSFASVTLGRMPNPFLSTDLIYDDDLNFDGISAKGRYSPWADDALGFSVTAGLFPLDYQSTSFPSNALTKEESRDKYLLAGQLGFDWRGETMKFKAGVGYYDFDMVQGRLSQPCFLTQGNETCSSDLDIPEFQQKGNTLFLLRNIQPDPADPLNFEQPQFAGLAFEYNVLDVTAEADFSFGRHHLVLTGSYVNNLGYDEADVCRYAPLGLPVNNVVGGFATSDPTRTAIYFNPCAAPPEGVTPAVFESGQEGWMARALFGRPTASAQGEWNLFAGYKSLQSDAVLDGFTDSDFHLGGTNAEGYFVGGGYALYRNTVLQLRWLSANEIYGPPLSIDVGQIDLNIRF